MKSALWRTPFSQSAQSNEVCCVIRGLRDPPTLVVPPAVWENSDGTGNREGGREGSEHCCRTYSPGWGVKRRAAAHLLHPGINPVVMAMVSLLLCSIITLPCSSLCCVRSVGMFIELTLTNMITVMLFTVCFVHDRWLYSLICFNRAFLDLLQKCCCVVRGYS